MNTTDFRVEKSAKQAHTTDAIVIGGGLAGLAAAIYLARGGKSVTLFEKSDTLGGRGISQIRAGYKMNLGAHALYDTNPAVEVLHELGVEYKAGSPVGVRTTMAGENYLAPANVSTLLRTKMLNVSEKMETARLLMNLQKANLRSLAGISLKSWLDKETSNPKVRMAVETSGRVATYTNAPDLLSAGLVAEQIQVLSKGKVLYVDGGWQTLIDGLTAQAKRSGVQIVTGASVEALEYSQDRPNSVSGVRLSSGERWGAQAVIITGSPRDAAKLAPQSKKLGEWQAAVPVHAACLDVVVRKLPNPRNKVVLAADQPLFFTAQGEFAKLGPSDDGGTAFFSLKYLDPRNPRDAEEDRRELEQWLDEIQPGWRAEVVDSRYLPNLVVNNALVEASQGGTFGRPAPKVPDIEGLFVAGDWVGERSTLAGASLWSAKEAAQAVLGAGSALVGARAA